MSTFHPRSQGMVKKSTLMNWVIFLLTYNTNDDCVHVLSGDLIGHTLTLSDVHSGVGDEKPSVC